jgi:hypothetical protein
MLANMLGYVVKCVFHIDGGLGLFSESNIEQVI